MKHYKEHSTYYPAGMTGSAQDKPHYSSHPKGSGGRNLGRPLPMASKEYVQECAEAFNEWLDWKANVNA